MAMLLKKRYSAPAWAFLAQVRNGTGFVRREIRTADALAMSLWPSRGLELHGFEIKISRSDWTRELNNPVKAEELFAFCDRWWIVAARDEIVQRGELPPTWGLLVIEGGGVRAVEEAPKLDALAPDKPLLAAILRRHTEELDRYVHVDDISDRLAKEYEAGKVAGEAASESIRGNLDALREQVRAFESASGVEIANAWNAGSIGRAVRDVVTRGPESCRRDIQSFRNMARRIADSCDELLADSPPPPVSA